MAPQLVDLINICLHKVSFPKSWASAKVVPLPKSGDLKQVGNWRPISLLPVPSKIMERVIYRRINNHLESNNLLTNMQYGFRTARGTNDAVFKLVNDIYKAKDCDEYMVTCFLDIRKAFDSVHQGELIARMRAMQLPPIYTDWLCAYLGDRSQSVICNGTTSNILPIKYGVPQGSILGPLLFICFVNNLPNVVKNSKMLLYADDVVFYCTGKSLKSTCDNLQEDASAIHTWFSRSGLSIRTGKTKIVTFGKQPTQTATVDITMGSTCLEHVNEYEYLGIILDADFTLVKTVSKSISTASNRNHMLGKMRRSVTKGTAILVYKQTILPVLEYCGYLYNGLIDSQYKRLQYTQNRCLRTCLLVKMKYHVTDLHKDTGVDYLTIRYDMQLLLLIHKYMYANTHNPEELGLRFQQIRPNARVTRQTGTGLLDYPLSIKTGYRRSPLYRGIDLWNRLNSSCRLSSSKDNFRSKAKSKVLELYELKLKR